MPLEALTGSASLVSILNGGVASVGRSLLLNQGNNQSVATKRIEESFASRIDSELAKLTQLESNPKIDGLLREQAILIGRKERVNEAIEVTNKALDRIGFIKSAVEHLDKKLAEVNSGTLSTSAFAAIWDNTLRKINILAEGATFTYKDSRISSEKNLIKSYSRTSFQPQNFLAPYNSSTDTVLISGSYLGTDYFLKQHGGSLFWNSDTGLLDTEAATGTLTEFSSQAGFPGSPTGRTESVTSINTSSILVERFTDGPLAVGAAAQEAVTEALEGGASNEVAFAAGRTAAQAVATAIDMPQEEFEAGAEAFTAAFTEAREGGASIEAAFAAASAVTAIGGNGDTGSSPDGEEVTKAFDNDADTKYSNTDGANSGVLIDLVTAKRADRFRLATAEDKPAGDPTSFSIFGSNDGTTFTSIVSSQSVTAPTDRKTDYGTLDFTNLTKFRFYKVIFNTVRIPTTTSDHSNSVATNRFIPVGGGGGTGTVPSGEEVSRAFDGSSSTEYRNTDGAGSGVIVDLSSSRIIDTLSLTTANDETGRDPTSFSVAGSSDGSSFTSIVSSQALTAPTGRQSAYDVANFSNNNAFRFYKVTFDSVRNSGSNLQIGEIAFDIEDRTEGLAASAYTAIGGIGEIDDRTDGLAASAYTAIGGSGGTGTSPDGEEVSKAFDNSTGTKYRNTDGAGSGTVIDLGSAKSVDRLSLTTADDETDRDPTSFSISGSNNGTTFTSIVSSQSLTAPAGRQTAYSDVNFSNNNAFRFYKVIFDSVRTLGSDVQISEIKLGKSDTGTSPDGEEVSKAFDDSTGTKYRNTDGAGSGVVINLGSAKSVDRLSLTTADNETGRDPTRVTISGSNDGTSFTQLTSSSLSAPSGRQTAYSDVTFTNNNQFQFYKIIFDSVRTLSSEVQISEIKLGKSDPTASIASSVITPVGNDGSDTGSSPTGQDVSKAFDGSTTSKYTNNDGAGSGVIIDLGATQLVDTVGLTTADDQTGRDPTSFSLSGSNDGTTFTSIVSSQSLTAPTGRQTAYSDAVFTDTNSKFFRFYKLTFDSVRTPGSAVQVSEIRLGVQAAGNVHISKINLGVVDQTLDEDQVLFTPSGGSSTTADITRGGLNILDAWMYQDFGTANLRNHAVKDLNRARGLVLTSEAQFRLDTRTLQSRAILFDPLVNGIERDINQISSARLSEKEAQITALQLQFQVAKFDFAILAARGNTLVASLILSQDSFTNGSGSSFKRTGEAILGATLSITV